MYNKAVSTFWVPEEIDLSKDIDHWNTLTDNAQYFIKHMCSMLPDLQKIHVRVPLYIVVMFFYFRQLFSTGTEIMYSTHATLRPTCSWNDFTLLLHFTV